ncbi:PDZ domain-containing protein [bacterium]|nr:PDZ domain-containing protein [bacterium]
MNSRFKILWVLSIFLLTFWIPLKAGPVPGSNGKDETEDIIKKVYPSVVKVEAKNKMRKVATGVVIDRDGYIVTTALIYPHNEEVYVITPNGKRVEAEFLGMDSMTHTALIRAKNVDLTPIRTGNSKGLSPGSWIGVVSISPENTPAVTQGIVSYKSPDKLRLNVWVVPGASGSPVVDKKGRMVGMLRGAYYENKPVVFELKKKNVVGSGYFYSRAEAPSSGMAVAIPINRVQNVAEEIKKKGKVERGWLGVLIAENEKGEVKILEVEKNSPADKSGLREGDIILQFEGKDISSIRMLSREIRKKNPEESVKVKIKRNGEVKTITVKLGEYTEKEMLKEFESKFPHLFPPKIPSTPESPSVERPRSRIFRFFWDQRKYIGVYLREINRELSDYFGVKEGKGLLVSKVEKGSPAEEAGIEVGDVLIRVEGKRIENNEMLARLIQGKEKGEVIQIELIRNKNKKTVKVKIQSEERGERNSFFNDSNLAGESFVFWKSPFFSLCFKAS